MLKEQSFEDGTTAHERNFFDCIKTRREPNAPVETVIAAEGAGHIGNLAYHRGGMTLAGEATTSLRFLQHHGRFLQGIPRNTVDHGVIGGSLAPSECPRNLVIARGGLSIPWGVGREARLEVQ
jgi:hypothetical protein